MNLLKMFRFSKMMKYAATDRNKQPILNELLKYIKKDTFLLEIASGTGQHVTHFAMHFPDTKFQPTEIEEQLFDSIKAYIEHHKLHNVIEPAYLNVQDDPCAWMNGKLIPASADYILNCNMIHVSPFEVCEGLFRGCGTYLKPNGLLFLYGPFAYDGVISPMSNVNFDKSLKSRCPAWGLRDVNKQLIPLASKYHLNLYASHRLPANNDLLVWKKVEHSN